MIASKVRHLAFNHESGEPFAFTPGQFISIHFPHGDREIRRSYSIASVPGQTDLLEFAVGEVPGGPGTELLFGLRPGDTVTASGPYGRLILREDEQPKRYVFVATSTGVTPFRSMLPQISQRISEHGLEVVMLLGIQTRDDLLYANEFIAFSEQHPQFTFRSHYSREAELTDPQDWERQGYVQTAFDELNLSPEHDIVYLCGNPAMIDDAFEKLKALNFEARGVRREKYISGK